MSKENKSYLRDRLHIGGAIAMVVACLWIMYTYKYYEGDLLYAIVSTVSVAGFGLLSIYMDPPYYVELEELKDLGE